MKGGEKGWEKREKSRGNGRRGKGVGQRREVREKERREEERVDKVKRGEESKNLGRKEIKMKKKKGSGVSGN